MTIKVLKNQSFYDLAIQATGDVDNAFAIAIANNMAVTDMPMAGTTLVIPDTLEADRKTAQYFAARNLKPATGLTPADIDDSEGEGIEFWHIEYDFVVS